MFQWNKSIDALNVSASEVISLFRSMREVQMALPGHPAQQTSAYLCQYRTEGGAATVVVFHLHKSELLAFFPSDPHVVPEGKVDKMFDKGLGFVESMGFLMTDQDIHLLDDSDQEMLWSSLPLKDGIVVEAVEVQEPTPAPAKTAKPKATKEPAVKAKASTDELAQSLKSEAKKDAPRPAPAQRSKPEPVAENNDNVDDLLAAVEAMRAKRPGLRSRKMPPPPEEMERRRQHLRETVGRVLASL